MQLIFNRNKTVAKPHGIPVAEQLPLFSLYECVRGKELINGIWTGFLSGLAGCLHNSLQNSLSVSVNIQKCLRDISPQK